MGFWRKYWAGIVVLAAMAAVWERARVEVAGADPKPNYSLAEKGLYVGGRVSKPPPGTEAVLSLSYLQDPYRWQVKVWNGQPIPDGKPAPSLEWLFTQVKFVAEERNAGHQVYVHCDAGMSRGPMVTLAYLMWEHHWGRDEALAYLRQQRPIVGPNRFFMALLMEWEFTLGTE